MRITQLLLARYGHFQDTALAFDPAISLHIVLGANEAGKSTALSAIADALFGFPHRTQFAFRHKDLRVGIGLQAADGRTGTFYRRKGMKDTLRGLDDTPLPESVMSAFLAGAGRARFEDMFGMDRAELRRGGTAILDGKGEVGASIVQAYAGPHHPRVALERLNDEALKLYGDKRGGRAFHIAADAFRAARHDIEERSVRPTAHKQAVEERDACLKSRADTAARLRALETERSRLDRIRRTAQPRAALAGHRAARDALGVVPDLPADAAKRRARAMQDREILRRELERLQVEQDRDQAALESLVPDVAILGEAGNIDALAADLKRIEGAQRDRETQRQEAARAQARMAEAGRRLGLALDPPTLMARLPDDLARAAAARAIDDHTALVARRRQLDSDWAHAADSAKTAAKALAALGEPESEDELAVAIDTARAEGRIDDELFQAEREATEASALLARALAALPLWQGSAEALAAAPIPLAAAIEGVGAASSDAEAALAERQRALAEIDARLREMELDLAALLAAGTPPTMAAIDAARARRDQAWRLIRRKLVEGGPPSCPEDMDGLPEDILAGFPGLIAAADALADRRAEEAERVAAYEHLRAGEARGLAQRNLARADLDRALALRQEAQNAWDGIWRPAGIAPGTPPIMREWLGRRDAVLADLREAVAKDAALAQVSARHARARATLLMRLAGEAGASSAAIAPLLRAAERRRSVLEAAWQRHSQARRALADAQGALDAQERKRVALLDEAETWRKRWQPLTAAIGLPENAEAQTGADALAIWSEIERHGRDRHGALQRIDQMTSEIGLFDAQLADCAGRSGAVSAADTQAGLVLCLTDRLTEARSIAQRRDTLTLDVATRAAGLRSAAEKLRAAEDQLATLRALAGAETDEALTGAIDRAAAAADLDRAIAERAAELRLLDDGMSFDELAREAADEIPESLPGRIAEIDERLRILRQANEDVLGRLSRLDNEIRAMEQGQDAAEAAQRMQDAAASAQEIAERYVRLRLAHSLLRAGIDRFRRAQQGPLLSGAGALFAALTCGRYARLATEEADDGKVIVVAQRPDGTHCPADRLSEGTRDQLYLALRLAAIGLHAAHAEPLPFIADDLLASFDDTRAQAALAVLEDFSRTTQTILFTHHAHIAAMADSRTMRVHRIDGAFG